MGSKEAIEAIRKKHGSEAIMPMSQGAFDVERLSTGIPTLDDAIGGGYPRGRIMEIYGPESSGKTTIALYMAKEAQKKDLRVAFLDLENALDPHFASEVVGVDIGELLISQPSHAEQAIDIVLELVKHDGADLIIVDSVAALVPRAEIEGDTGDSHMGLVARLMSQALRKINNLQIQHDSNATILFLNQLRNKIGIMFGNPETTTGGEALKYYSSVRLDTRSPSGTAGPEKPGRIMAGEKRDKNIGKRIKVKVAKNKVAPPFRECFFDLLYETGVDEHAGLFEVALSKGLIGQKGAWYYDSNGEKLAQGRDKTIDYLRENPEFTEELRSKL